MKVATVELFDSFGFAVEGIHREGVAWFFVISFCFAAKHFEVVSIGDVVDCQGDLGDDILGFDVNEPLPANLGNGLTTPISHDGIFGKIFVSKHVLSHAGERDVSEGVFVLGGFENVSEFEYRFGQEFDVEQAILLEFFLEIKDIIFNATVPLVEFSYLVGGHVF